MEEIKAYKCGYCGKLYQRKRACRRHEDNDCLKNPKIRPICFDCEFMQRSEETEDVPYPAEIVGGWSGTAYLKFERTTCHRTGAKMYVDVHLSEEAKYGLDDEGWEAMPTHAEGCKYAKLYRYDYGKNDNRGEEKGQGEED